MVQSGEDSIAFARVCAAQTAEIEDMIRLHGKCGGVAPAVFTENEMADARLVREFSRALEPMVEPAEQDCIGIEQGLRPEVRSSRTVAPGQVDPWAGDQVLVISRDRAACAKGEGEEAVYAALEIGVVPAGNVQRRDANTIEGVAYAERGPVFAGIRVVKPVEDVSWQALAMQRGMIAEGYDAGLG